jgi:hypothetical protein
LYKVELQGNTFDHHIHQMYRNQFAHRQSYRLSPFERMEFAQLWIVVLEHVRIVLEIGIIKTLLLR